MKTNRIIFLDAVRAFAILMMLQGHFIDSLLDPIYRDSASILYQIWKYFRGNTAPTFFTITGLVFTFLLLKAKEKGTENARLKKGLRRGLELIIIGYLLRAKPSLWLKGRFSISFLKVDVLQCIGLSLLLIVGLYYLSQKRQLVFTFLMLLAANIFFLTEPIFRDIELPSWPILFGNYISKSHGSVFTIFPWFGFVGFGACIAFLLYKNVHRTKFKPVAIASFLIIGLLLVNYSSKLLLALHSLTSFELLYRCANYNYLYLRLGNVLIIFSVFYAIEKYLNNKTVFMIGTSTLTIYVIHFLILYRGISGLSLYALFKRSLDPTQAIIGALLFLISVVLINWWYHKKAKHYPYKEYFRTAYLFVANKIQQLRK